jgi:hypothetical protein
VTLVGNSLPGAAREEIRYVPQLELTDLRPIKVSFSPDDNTLLVVVNRNGRIDLFDLSNPGRPVKITEIAANAQDAIFSHGGIKSRSSPAASTAASGYGRSTASRRPSPSRDTKAGSIASPSPPTGRASSPAEKTAASGYGRSTASRRPSPSRDIKARS